MTAEISVFSERRISDFRDMATSESISGLSDRGEEVSGEVAAWLEAALGLVFAVPVYLYLRRFAAIHSNVGFLLGLKLFSE